MTTLGTTAINRHISPNCHYCDAYTIDVPTVGVRIVQDNLMAIVETLAICVDCYNKVDVAEDAPVEEILAAHVSAHIVRIVFRQYNIVDGSLEDPSQAGTSPLDIECYCFNPYSDSCISEAKRKARSNHKGEADGVRVEEISVQDVAEPYSRSQTLAVLAKLGSRLMRGRRTRVDEMRGRQADDPAFTGMVGALNILQQEIFLTVNDFADGRDPGNA